MALAVDPLRLFRTTSSALPGLLASVILAGCASTAQIPEPVAAPGPTVVVRTARETPPAELTRCPTVPAGLPGEGAATILPAWRSGIIRLPAATRADRPAEPADRLEHRRGVSGKLTLRGFIFSVSA